MRRRALFLSHKKAIRCHALFCGSSSPVASRLLLDNRYIYQDFWNYRNGKLTETAWQRNFADANKAARTALAQRDTATVLSIVLSRLYTLRNQLMHGGAT
jgi:hypothetical protein